MNAQAVYAVAGGIVVAVLTWIALTPGVQRQAKVDRILAISARPQTWSLGRGLRQKLAPLRSLHIAMAALVIVLALAFGWPWLVLGAGIPWAAPAVLRSGERSREAKRRREIEREVAPALDVIVLSLEAGLPFDRALAAYTSTAQSLLAAELGTALRELEVGYRRREAIQRVVTRTASPTLAAVESSIRLAEDFGTPLAAGLRSLAGDLRAQRRQRLQEMALRAPVTMLLPTAGLILVPIFLIVLGPIAIRVFSGTLF